MYENDKITKNGPLADTEEDIQEEYGSEEQVPEEHRTSDVRSDEYPSSPERIAGYLVSDIELCIGTNTDYYLAKFRKLPALRINGSATLCAINWMVYRHIWREALMVYFIQLASMVVVSIFLIIGMKNGLRLDTDEINLISMGAHVVYCLAVGLFGDSLYWRKIRRELDRFNRQDSTTTMTEEEKQELRDRTQPSGFYVIMSIALYLLSNRVILSLTELILFFV